MLADPWVWFYYFWIPEYLTRSAGFTAADVGKYAWIPFLAQGVGIVLGGMLSDVLLRRGVRAVQARLAIMLIGMLLMTPGILAAFELDIVIIFAGISSAMFGFGFWAPNMMSLCADAFPRTAVGSVVGLSGMGAGVGGMLFTMLIGWTLDRYGYPPVFIAAGVIPLLAFVVLFVVLEREPEDSRQDRQGRALVLRRIPPLGDSIFADILFRHRGDRLDLDQEIRQRERGHADERVRRGRGVAVERTDLAEDRAELVGRMVDDVRAQPDDVRWRATRGLQHHFEIRQRLTRLRAVVAGADDVGLRIPAHLAGEMQRLAALLQGRVREAEFEAVVELLGIDAFDAH